MSDFLISLFFGVGVGVFLWSKMVQGTGNAAPAKTVAGAGIVGFIAFLFFFSLLKWVFHIG